MKSDAPSELRLLLTKIRLRITVNNELEINHGKYWSLLGNKEDINRRNKLHVQYLTYTSLFYVQLRSASSSELEYFKLLYHLYFFITLPGLWSLSKANNNKLDVFQTIFLRQIIRNKNNSNSGIYKLCNIEPYSNELHVGGSNCLSPRKPSWKCAC